jgi:hypothetical protein
VALLGEKVTVLVGCVEKMIAMRKNAESRIVDAYAAGTCTLQPNVFSSHDHESSYVVIGSYLYQCNCGCNTK